MISDTRDSSSTIRKNERSAIEFPYLDLDTAAEVARALYQRAGLGACEIDELAAEMGQTISGAFRLKTGAAKLFGLLEKDARSAFRLSALGQQIVNSESEPKARADAFLNIPLYSAIYEKYRGHLLPPDKALEKEMASLGVAPKQTDKARQVFERSARQAGFFEQGDDRLVLPRFARNVVSSQMTPTMPTGEVPPPIAPAPTSKPLRYLLIDMLNPNDMTDEEQKAVWTLINYLARKNLPDGGKAHQETSPSTQGVLG